MQSRLPGEVRCTNDVYHVTSTTPPLPVPTVSGVDVHRLTSLCLPSPASQAKHLCELVHRSPLLLVISADLDDPPYHPLLQLTADAFARCSLRYSTPSKDRVSGPTGPVKETTLSGVRQSASPAQIDPPQQDLLYMANRRTTDANINSDTAPNNNNAESQR